jgi:hypothetical protein
MQGIDRLEASPAHEPRKGFVVGVPKAAKASAKLRLILRLSTNIQGWEASGQRCGRECRKAAD